MRIIADFHIHSRYSRAVSRDMTPENLDMWARKKGITVMGTGDFTHPKWLEELKEKLEPAEEGLYQLKSPIINDPLRPPRLGEAGQSSRLGVALGEAWVSEASKLQINSKLKISNSKTRFLPTVEIAVIYSKGGKVRRIHHLVFAPSFAAVEKINKKLLKIGNLSADGRPMLGLDSKELLKIVKDADNQAVLVPAHAWTPWFSVFGSMSGFDSLEECFEELTPEIFAIETGLSSDPPMNWRVPALENIALISNSDSHSLRKIGREANIFDCELSYKNIMEAIQSRDPKKFLCTIEFFPEEGKYHYDGHRDLRHCQGPEETKKAGGRCAACGAKVTVGVLSRVEELANARSSARRFSSVLIPTPSAAAEFIGSPPTSEKRHARASQRIPYKSLVPLQEIIADVYGVGVASKRVQNTYEAMIEHFGSEFTILLNASYEELARFSPEIAEGITCVHEGKVAIMPGYDGEYGKVAIVKKEKQPKLFNI